MAACREELITRNVATLVEPPSPESRDLSPWSLDGTLAFLSASRRDPLYAAFVLAIALDVGRLFRCRPYASPRSGGSE